MSELGAELKKIALEYPWSQAAANEFWNANTEAFASGHDSSEVRSRRDRNAATFMVDFSKRA